MSAGLSIAALVGLFIVFGVFALGDRGRQCHDCPSVGRGGCGACDQEEVH
jgi:hypothetical protein